MEKKIMFSHKMIYFRSLILCVSGLWSPR